MATVSATKTASTAKNKTAAVKVKAKPSQTTNTYIYKGVDRKGSKIQGEINGTSPAIVKALLIKQGINVKSVSKKSKPLFGTSGKAIKPADIAVFSRQMATMMKAGVPLVQAFDIVADGLENPNMKSLVLEIRDDVAAGGGFAASLRKHPRYFDDLFCNLVDAGEQSGALETMLDRIATYKEKTEALKAKIKKAMTYPIAVIVVAIVVTGILLVKVVPQFAATFASFGADLPAFTLFVLHLSDLAQQWWFLGMIGIGGSFYLFKEAKLRSKKFAYLVDRYVLKLPIIGKIVYLSIMARFARTLSTTFAAGVPLIDALTSVAGAAGNRIYSDAILKVREDVSTGIQLNAALRSGNLFPTLLVQMSAIGEESGALDEMLDKVAIYYEGEVDNMVDNLTSLLEPMIISVLGILVGGLMVAMYLPIFQIGAVI
ncbi:type II secretion system F family protein [Cellvibrio japonicus]|uniref:Type IV pilus biogenesis protein PilC n=1 Tax=Cellvibrio japonicus (strain Ueda107) TaxID=498211 RepID=B3PBG4_CELJU|nr:type II secretion system F family protein [Cellvibrio japonicus]ACE82964.1 type IV pilus biogenesis protein PilC [Cellvibrio japonicus Ueda107]QEI13080.1 type II secretion system F family protein [Cellvibrio japonicus]QEI16654.1 type II secretion system F family protein [Cellvibrio japonicus]QEI20232.1 type II secretion system F family protein [Cellvibrio japonicus]